MIRYDNNGRVDMTNCVWSVLYEIELLRNLMISTMN